MVLGIDHVTYGPREGMYLYTLMCQILFRDRSCSNQRCGHATGVLCTSCHIVILELEQRRQVGMPRPGSYLELVICGTVPVTVVDHEQQSAVNDIIFGIQAIFEGHCVDLFPGSSDTVGWFPQCHFLCNVVLVDVHADRQAFQYASDTIRMTLSEQGEP